MPNYHKVESEKTTRHVWDFPAKELIALLKHSLKEGDHPIPTGKAFLLWERQSQFKRTRTLSLVIDD